MPMRDPVDDGEFVCSLSYGLYSINGFKLKQIPLIEHSTHDLEFVVSGSRGFISWPESTSDEFKWTDLLSEEDKELVYTQIPFLVYSLDGDNRGPQKCNLLTVNEIQQSYRNGDVVEESLGKLQLAIGFGSEWSPALYISDFEIDSGIEDDISFPLEHPPISIITIPLMANADEKDFERVFQVVKILIDAHHSAE